jgi:hypothetical protein
MMSFGDIMRTEKYQNADDSIRIAMRDVYYDKIVRPKAVKQFGEDGLPNIRTAFETKYKIVPQEQQIQKPDVAQQQAPVFSEATRESTDTGITGKDVGALTPTFAPSTQRTTAADVLRRETEGTKGVGLFPFIRSGIQAEGLLNVYRAIKRVEAGEGSESDKDMIFEFNRKSEEEFTFGGKVATVLAELPSFAGELLTTGGIYTGVKKVTTKAITKTINKYLGAKGAALLTKKAVPLGVQVAGGIAGGTAQTIPAGVTRIPAKALENMIGGDDVTPAMIKALGDQWVEVLSEKSGGLFTKLGSEARNAAVKHGLVKSLLKANPDKDASALRKLVQRAGYNGILEEVLEERVGEVGRAALGLEDWQLPTGEQLLVELTAFSIPGVAISLADKVMTPSGKIEDAKTEEVPDVREERSDTDATGAVVEPPQEAVTQVPKAEVATEAVPKSEDVTVKPEVKRAEDTEEATVAEDVADVAEDQVVADEAGTEKVPETVEKAKPIVTIDKDGNKTVSDPDKMTFDEFETEYRKTFAEMSKYTPDQAGASMLSEKMAELNDAHPDWVEVIESRPEQNVTKFQQKGKAKEGVVFRAGSQELQDELNYQNTRNSALRNESPPATPPVSQAEGVKEPWQMTRDEFGKSVGVSEKESFGIVETQSAVAEPNSTTAKLSFGEEVVVGKKDNFHTYTNPKSGKVFKFDVVRTKSPDGRMRFIANYGGSDQVAAGIVIDSDGRAITAKAHETGTGLIQSLLREAKQDFGKIIPQKPISKQGLRALHRSEIQQALSEGKPVKASIIREYPDLATRFLVPPKGIKGYASIFEGSLNSLSGNLKAISDFSKSDAFRKKGLGGFDVPTQGLVMNRVLSALHQLKIRNVVIDDVPVDVMDNLISIDLPANVSFHDGDMFVDNSPIIAGTNVPIRISSANTLVRGIAGLSTEVSRASSETVRGAKDATPAIMAIDIWHDINIAQRQVKGKSDVLKEVKDKKKPPEVLNDYPDLAKKHGKKGNAKAQDKIKTISGEFTYDEFEARGYEPSEVTQSEWVLLMRSLRRSLGQDETSGNPNAPYAEYKEFHRRSVEDALKSGDTVDERVLQSYPDLKPEAKPAEGNGEIKKAEEIKFFEDEIKKTKKSKASEISDVGTFSTYKTKQSKINALQEELDNARKRPARLYNTQPTPTAEEQLKPAEGGVEADGENRNKILWRGTTLKVGTFKMGEGLYLTEVKDKAKFYGDVKAFVNAYPKNPLIIKRGDDFVDWLLRESGLKNIREFNKKHSIRDFVKAKGYDGVVDNTENEIVLYDPPGNIKSFETKKEAEDYLNESVKRKTLDDRGNAGNDRPVQAGTEAKEEETKKPTPTAEEQLKPKKGKGGGLLSQERNLPAPTKERKGFEVTARLPVAPIKTEGKKRLSELKFDLGKTFGRKVEKGKISRRALGTYFPWSGRVVIKYAGDLDSASHEIGHYLDDLFGFMPELFTAKMNKAGIVQRRMNEKGKPMRAELESFWQHGSVTQGGPRSRLDYKLGEAAAEWVRAYIMNPEATRKQAPLLTAHILGKLDEKARTGLTKISDQVRGWAGRSATERVLSNVKIKPKRSGRLGEILDSFEKSEDVEFHTTWIDRMWNAPVIDKLYPFFRAIQTAKDLRGIKNLNPMKDPYILTRLLPGIETVIEDQFENGAIDFEKWNEGKFERDADVKGVSWLLAPLDNTSNKTLEKDMGLVLAQLISERTIERADVLDRQSFRKLEKDIERFLDNRSQAIVNSRNLSKEEKNKAFESIADMREILGNARSVEGSAVNKLLVLANEFPGKFGKLAQREYQSNKFRKQRLSGIGGGIFSDLESAKETLAELDNLDAESRGRISEAADRYRKFADAMVLKPLLHSGRISKVQYDAIKEDNQFYVNMSRVMEDAGLPIPQPSGKRLGAVSEPIKKFKGGTREMENPYVSLLGQATLAQREASRNKALVAVRDLLTIHRGINEGKPINLASIGKKTMAGDDNTIKIFVDGKPEYWKFESGVYKAMKSWGQTIDNNILLQVLRLPAKILRVSITHSPPFIIRNVIRDTVHRTVISRTGSKITDIKIVTEDDISKLMAAGGGQFGHYMKNPFNYYKFLRRSMLDLSKDPFTILVTSPAKLARRYNKLSQSSEYVNRLAEFRSAIKKFQKEGFSEVESMTKAALEARDLMDFSRSGYVTEYINSFIPFTNAAVQGIRRTALAAKENPGKFTALWGLYVLAPTLLMYAWNNRDDDSEERYHDTSPWYRDFYWNMYLGDKLWLRVPKPFEIGVLASGVERTIDNFRGYENAYDGYGEAVVKSFLPFDQSSLLGPFKTVIETMTNYDTFRNRNIVSKWEVDKPIEERKGTKYASKLGQIMQDLSKDQVDARIIDHVVRSQFADLGRTALDISNIGEADKKQTLATWLKDAFGIFGQNSEWVARDLYINRLNVISEKNDNRASAMRQNWNSKHPEYKIAKRKGKYVEN